jgi:inositol hexakisphosphate/diphosphoinositol-pentakisphosphate kinase
LSRCCGDEPWLFRERWEKLFEDFCDVKPEKFDPSRVSELYDTIKYCALHHRTFLFAIFGENGGQGSHQPRDRKLHELYGRAKALFDLVAPQEYGIEPEEKEEIGVLTSLPLLRKVVEDLEEARNHGRSSLTCYFTKESHIHTLVNLVLLSGLPIANRRIPELDYASHITFELYERNYGRSKSDKEYSIKLSISEGAHSSNVLDSALDARHSLNVQQRRKLTQHLPYSLVIEKLSKHFGRTPEDDDGPDTLFVLEALPVTVALESSSDDP